MRPLLTWMRRSSTALVTRWDEPQIRLAPAVCERADESGGVGVGPDEASAVTKSKRRNHALGQHLGERVAYRLQRAGRMDGEPLIAARWAEEWAERSVEVDADARARVGRDSDRVPRAHKACHGAQP